MHPVEALFLFTIVGFALILTMPFLMAFSNWRFNRKYHRTKK